ncbi:MAG: hypothetical protein WC615_19525 [Mucilaginibacter sp.]|uniref:hypothetical protein n=1 Tax=Mucilaginibacter sp. TaxID=1882438 RepID=UPI00356129FE
MTIKQLYCYYFYTLYKAWLSVDNAFGATGPFKTSNKALICMFPAELWLLFSIGIYCGRIFNIHLHIPFLPILAPAIILYIIKWFVFDRENKWKGYVNEFDKWPKGKNRAGGWVVVTIIMFVLLNFIFAVNINLQSNGIK